MTARSSFLALATLLTACEVAPVDARPVREARAESDERPTLALEHQGVHLGTGRGALALPDGRFALVDDADALVLVDGATRTHLLDHVTTAPLALPDGRLLASRTTEAGESDLWLVTLDRSSPPRALAAARGADALPFLLDDGRVLFTSTRTGVASLFIVGLEGRGLRQLTNAGLAPGKLKRGFVPTPLDTTSMRREGARVSYDAGEAIWSIDVDTGVAQEAR